MLNHFEQLLLIRSYENVSKVIKLRFNFRLTFVDLRAPLLNDELVKAQLLRGSLKHSFFNTVFCDEAEYVNLFRLPDAMCAIHSL